MALCLLLSTAGPATAQWVTQASVNTAVSTAASDAAYVTIEPGASNGTFVLWGQQTKVYLQFLDSQGKRRTLDALVASPAWEPKMVSDGAGGVIVAWTGGDWKIWAQRFDSSLSPQWSAPVRLTATGTCAEMAITTDGAGGAIVSWTTRASTGGQPDIAAQRVDSTGALQWNATTGFVVVSHSAPQTRSALAPGAAAGSAFVVWEDQRSGHTDLWVRRIDGTSTGSTTASSVVTAPQSQTYARIVSDGSGGALVAWRDARSGGSTGLYLQRLDAQGARVWQSPWEGLHVGGGLQRFDLGSDGAGGAVLVWNHGNGASPYADLMFQRVTASGIKVWGSGLVGLPLTTGSSNTLQRNLPRLAADGAGGATIVWNTGSQIDHRASDVYAQRVTAAGGASWRPGGIVVSKAPNGQYAPDVTLHPGCTAKIAWADHRDDGEPYAQRVLCYGGLGKTFPSGLGLAPLGAATLGIGEPGDFGIIVVGGGDGDVYTGPLGPAVFQLAFDPELLRVLEVVPGSLEGLEVEIVEESGTVRVTAPDGGMAFEGEALFSVQIEGLRDGVSSLALVEADLGEEIFVTGESAVVRIGDGGGEPESPPQDG